METKTAPLLCEITADGRTPSQLVAAIEAQGKKVWPYARGIVLGEGKDPFPEVPAGENWRLGVLFASELGKYPTSTQVWAEMGKRGLGKPHPAAALYLREKYSQEDLLAAVNALRPAGAPEVSLVIVMHEPIRDSDGNPRLLGLDRDGGEGDVDAYDGDPGREWRADGAFVVLLPQEDSGSQVSSPRSSELSPSVSVPRAWLERLVEVGADVGNSAEFMRGYIESARGLLTDVTKGE